MEHTQGEALEEPPPALAGGVVYEIRDGDCEVVVVLDTIAFVAWIKGFVTVVK